MMIASKKYFLNKVIAIGLALLLSASLWGGLAPAPVQAAPNASGSVLYVNNYDDDPNASACRGISGDCSLRGAINRANQTAGSVTIYLQNGGYNLFGDVNATEDNNVNGDLDIRKDGGGVTIIGDSISTTTINGNHVDRIFDVQDVGAPTRLTLQNLSLVNGFAGPMQDGGSIRSYGSVTLDTVFISNSLGREGGAIYIYSTYDQKLVINRSVISRATATLDGGAIYAEGETTTISNSTFDHNVANGSLGYFFNNDKAGRGGAIYNNSSLTVSNSTFAYNNAHQAGGAILNYAFLGQSTNAYINSSTFEGNGTAVANVATASGTLRTSAVTTIANSILDSSTETENCVNIQDDKGMTSFVNGGSNLDSGVSCGFGSNGGSIFGQNPHLGELADYGGPTPTLPLLDGSPAIDKANPSSSESTDERGLAAVGRRDIGAFEANASPILSVTVGPGKGPLPDGSQGTRLAVTVRNQLGTALPGWSVSFDPADGASIALSANSVRTDANGIAVIYALANVLANTQTLISVTSGGATGWFTATSLGFFPYGHGHILPNTGFDPGLRTLLPRQPQRLAYANEGDLSLQIDKLNLKLPVVGIPHANDQWDITWLSNQAGYLEGTAFPSWQGNSVITGHSVLADGTAGPFARLNTLAWGDRLQLQVYGQRYTYEVRSVKSLGPDDESALAHKDGFWITLLTCKDFNPASHTYLKRLAVSAVLVQ